MKKAYVLSLVCMCITAAAGLVLCSILAYYLKWQAFQGTIGIIGIYICCGLTGGCALRGQQRSGRGTVGRRTPVPLKQAAAEGALLAGGFLLLLWFISIMADMMSGIDALRVVTLWFLLWNGAMMGEMVINYW